MHLLQGLDKGHSSDEGTQTKKEDEKRCAPGRIQTHNLLITIHSVIVLQVLPITFLVNFRTLASRVSVLSIRNRHETLEEKKTRKNAVKELKRERRVEKKANKLAFKEEKTRQEKITLNNPSTGLKLL